MLPHVLAKLALDEPKAIPPQPVCEGEPVTRIVCITSGGDWADASFENLVVHQDLDLAKAKQDWRRWYAKYVSGRTKSEYITFTEWLKRNHGATDAGIEEFDDG